MNILHNLVIFNIKMSNKNIKINNIAILLKFRESIYKN